MLPVVWIALVAPAQPLLVALPEGASFDTTLLVEELAARVPDTRPRSDEANAAPHFVLQLDEASRDGDEAQLAFRLFDPADRVLIEQRLAGESLAIARQLAVLVEGILRVHARLEAPAPPAVNEEAAVPRAPLVTLELGAGAALLARAAAWRSAIQLAVGVPLGLVSPRLELVTDLVESSGTSPTSYAVSERSLAALAELALPLEAWSLLAAAGLSLTQDRALAGGDTSRTTSLGARISLAGARALTPQIALLVRLAGDLIPRYPEHFWHGEEAFQRGPLRLTGLLGLRFSL